MAEEQAHTYVPAAKRRKLEKKEPHPMLDKLQCEVQYEKGGVTEKPLLFFFDMETTGLGLDSDEIIELAGKVIDVPPYYVTHLSFSSLVHTSRQIQHRASELTGITNAMLVDSEPLTVVLPRFLRWIHDTKEEVSRHTGSQYYPVLVAHNGLRFDVPILLAEIERRPNELTASALAEENIHFADTLQCLQQAKKKGHPALRDVQSFSLDNLRSHFAPENPHQGHRALRDVEAMEDIFRNESLHNLLTSLAVQTARDTIQQWRQQRELRREKKSLMDSLGQMITDSQAKSLLKKGLDFSKLCRLRASFLFDDEFQKQLQRRKVGSQKLCEILTTAVPKTLPQS